MAALDLKKWASSKAARSRPVTFDPDEGPDSGPEADNAPPMGKIKAFASKNGMQLVTGSQAPEREGRGWRTTVRIFIPDTAIASW